MTESSVWNWESNATKPKILFLPAILRLLRYNPLPEADTFMAKFRRISTNLGLTQEGLALKLGIDESTIAHWEQGESRPVGLYRKLVEDFATSGGSLVDAADQPLSTSSFSVERLDLIPQKSRVEPCGLSTEALCQRTYVVGVGERRPNAAWSV